MTKQQPATILKWIKLMRLSHLHEEHQRYSSLVKGDYDGIACKYGLKWETYDDYVSILRAIHERIIARKYKWELMPLDEIQSVVDKELEATQ